jgi:hypothetical protein
MVDAWFWEKGYTIAQYVDRMRHYQKEMQERLRDLRITPSECQKLKIFTSPRKILILTESWCADSLMNIPVVVKMAECAPNLEIKVYIRSENPDLVDYFHGKQVEKIPVFWIMDGDYEMVGYWSERPKAAYKMVARWKQENPEFDRIRLDEKLEPTERFRQFAPYKAKYVDEMWNWYDTGLQSDTINEVFTILQK